MPQDAPKLPISIHAPRGGSDPMDDANQQGSNDFNPRSPWGERPYPCDAADDDDIISIHAPRGGSDSWMTGI